VRRPVRKRGPRGVEFYIWRTYTDCSEIGGLVAEQYHLFPLLKQNLVGHRFKYDSEVEAFDTMADNTGHGLLFNREWKMRFFYRCPGHHICDEVSGDGRLKAVVLGSAMKEAACAW